MQEDKLSEPQNEEHVEETANALDEPKQMASKLERAENCKFNEKRLNNLEKFGLIPMAVFAAGAIIATIVDSFPDTKNLFNLLFMALAMLSLAIYEGITIFFIKSCKCPHCSNRIKVNIILLVLGLVFFIIGLSLFLVYLPVMFPSA